MVRRGRVNHAWDKGSSKRKWGEDNLIYSRDGTLKLTSPLDIYIYIIGIGSDPNIQWLIWEKSMEQKLRGQEGFRFE